MTRPAVLYLRASTSRQDKSCDDQRAECIAYARRVGVNILREFRDDGVSAFKRGREGRRGFDEMLRFVEGSREMRGGSVLVWSLSRFSRQFGDGLLQMLQLGKLGVAVEDVKGGRREVGDLVGLLLAAVETHEAQAYSQAISDGVKRGHRQRRRDGYWTHPAPYGYRTKRESGGCVLVPEPRQARIVRLMYELADQGASPYSIARELTRRGVSGVRSPRWSPVSVLSVLRGASYGGLHRCATTGKETPARIETFLPADLWRRVYELHRPKRGKRRAPPSRKLPLSGLVVCGACGAPAWMRGGGTPRYQCSRRIRWRCGNHTSADAGEVGDALLAWARSLLTSSDIRALARDVVAAHREQHLTTARERKPIDDELAELDRQEAALLDLQLAGGQTRMVADRLAGIEARRDELHEQAADLGGNVEPLPLDLAAEAVRRALAATTVRELRPALDRITLQPGGVVTVDGFGQVGVELPVTGGRQAPQGRRRREKGRKRRRRAG